jgi:hypothetical protein
MNFFTGMSAVMKNVLAFAVGFLVVIQPQVAVAAQEKQRLPDVVRIEADIASSIPHWSGVRSCSSERRARGYFEAAYSKWRVNKLKSYPDYHEVRHGPGEFTRAYRNKRRPFPSRARYCNGSITRANVWIELAR